MKKILILIQILPAIICYGQLEIKVPKERLISADEVNRRYEFNPGRELSHQEMINFWSSDFVNTNSKTLPVYESINKDSYGNEHYIYKQYYNGVEIENERMVVHKNQRDRTIVITGKLSAIDNVSSTPVINEEVAVSKVKETFGNSSINYLSNSDETGGKSKNEAMTIFPNTKLVYLKTGENYKLAYTTLVSVKEPFDNLRIYIDATNGEVIKRNSLVKKCFGKHDEVKGEGSKSSKVYATSKEIKEVAACDGNCHPGTGNSLYYGNVSINTGKYMYNFIDCKYRLFNNCTGTNIRTRDHLDAAGEITDQDNDWQYLPTRPGVTAHWCGYMAFNYFLNNFSRNSFDDAGAEFNIYTNNNYYGTSNAFWSGINVQCGTGGESGVSYGAITTLDIIGHEFTHGIDQYSANLDYNNEPGALSESFADMFGAMVEHYAKTNFLSSSGNYTQGEDAMYPNCAYFRNMANPKQYCQPNTYGGQYYYWGPNDNGGVHTNSGVGNYWFYLLAEGGFGQNDNNSNYCVRGIGKQKAAAIAYSTLINYLPAYNSLPSYYDARVASISAAQAMYGNNSEEVAAVTAAWYAVGVGMDYTGFINLNNLNVNTSYTKNYFHQIALNNLTVNTGGVTDISSATGIKITNSKSYLGSNSKFYIASGCNLNGKLMNTQLVNPVNIKDEEIGLINETPLFNLFPNPSEGQFTIEQNNNEEVTIEISDIQGKLLKSFKQTGNKIEVNLTGFEKGMYFITLESADNKTTKKIIIE